MTREAGKIAEEEAKNPINYIPGSIEVKSVFKAPVWLARIFRSKKAAEGTNDIRVAGGGIELTKSEGPGLLARALNKVLRYKAGFSGNGRPIILDEDLSAKGMAEALRAKGYNVRSVREIYGTGTTDDEIIYDLAKRVDARVLTRDLGRQPTKGFFERGITVDSRVRTPDEVARVLEDGLK